MPITVLSAGPRHAILQDVVYVLPAKTCTLFSDVALQVSMDPAFGASQAVTANTSTRAAGQYVRCTVSAANVKVSVD